MHASDEFSTAFEFASGATGERFQNPLWQITEVFMGSQFRRSIATVKNVGGIIVSNAMKNRKSLSKGDPDVNEGINGVSSTIKGSLINSLLDAIEDKQMVADAALNYLSAGMSCKT